VLHFNDAKAFWSITYNPLLVRQVDGSQISAKGYGEVVIHQPYLHLPSVITEHTKQISFMLHKSVVLHFQSLPVIVSSIGIDFIIIKIVHPTSPPIPPVPVLLTPVANYVRAPIITRSLLHQRFGHISDDMLDKMCHCQTRIGLIKVPLPCYDYECPIC
jgi:hypothetical protein